MQLRAEQLHGHLAKSLAPVYAVHGDEPLLALEAADAVRAAARRQGFSERVVLEPGRSFDWSEFTHAAASLSLFAEKKLVELRLAAGKPGSQGAEAIAAYCSRPSADIVLLVSVPRLDRSTQNSAWFRALAEAGVIVDVYPVDRPRLPAWIAERLALRSLCRRGSPACAPSCALREGDRRLARRRRAADLRAVRAEQRALRAARPGSRRARGSALRPASALQQAAAARGAGRGAALSGAAPRQRHCARRGDRPRHQGRRQRRAVGGVCDAWAKIGPWIKSLTFGSRSASWAARRALPRARWPAPTPKRRIALSPPWRRTSGPARRKSLPPTAPTSRRQTAPTPRSSTG